MTTFLMLMTWLQDCETNSFTIDNKDISNYEVVTKKNNDLDIENDVKVDHKNKKVVLG